MNGYARKISFDEGTVTTESLIESNRNATIDQPLALNGVHHSARPTWKLGETVRFYRDVLGLKLVHAITAKGWGPENHPDFLHFFFDSGQGSTIAFFYYIGTECPDYMGPRPDDYLYRAHHTAWQVKDANELHAWRARLERHGVKVSPDTKHELIESIYFDDPNGYMLEITLQTRPFLERDAIDAALTMTAAMELEEHAGANGRGIHGIYAVWEKKADLIESSIKA